MITGWLIIVGVLFVTYTIEVFKGLRTIPYLVVFLLLTVAPAIVGLVLYLKKPDRKQLCYVIVWGYFIMYLFVLVTGKSSMVSTYILPMLSLMVLYHKPNLILSTGIASLVANIASIIYRFRTGALTMETSDQAEIQVALIILCFGGSYVAARLYNEITRQNERYLKMLNEKNEQIQEMTMQTITTVANALDAKDKYSEGHSRRVAIYAAQLAEKLGLTEDEVMNIRIIALLHDIGKIGVPDSVLKKAGRLDKDEFALMKQHTVVGSEILKDINMIPGIDIGTRYHHERYDGTGYPEGLKGENIPYVARIIAVADSYDAMTSNRVYRDHLTNEQVMSELKKGEGTQFDPVIVKLMEQLLNDGVIKNLSPDMSDTA